MRAKPSEDHVAAEIRGEFRRLTNLLLVGHGAALLIIFNARAAGTLETSTELRTLSWCFLLGLISAFLSAFISVVHDQQKSAPLALLETVHTRADAQGRRSVYASWAAMFSAALFVGGLFWAVDSIGPHARKFSRSLPQLLRPHRRPGHEVGRSRELR